MGLCPSRDAHQEVGHTSLEGNVDPAGDIDSGVTCREMKLEVTGVNLTGA